MTNGIKSKLAHWVKFYEYVQINIKVIIVIWLFGTAQTFYLIILFSVQILNSVNLGANRSTTDK